LLDARIAASSAWMRPSPPAWKSASDWREAPTDSHISLVFRGAAQAAELADEFAYRRTGLGMILGVGDLRRH